MMRIALTTLMLVLVSPTSAQHKPGFTMKLTSPAVDYVNRVAKVKIEELLQNLKINDMADYGGNPKFSLKNIHSQGLVSPNSNIAINPDLRGLTWTVDNFGIVLYTDYWAEYKLWFIPITVSGGLVASFSGVSMSLTVGLDVDADSRPLLISRGCGASIGGLNLDFKDGSAWLMNLIKGLFTGNIRDTLRDKLCEVVENTINGATRQTVSQMQLLSPIADHFVLDWKLLSNVEVTPYYLESKHKGEVYWRDDLTTESPFSPYEMPAWGDNSRMLYASLSVYTPKTLAYVAQKHYYLEYIVSPDKLKDDNKDVLNTTCPGKICIGSILTQLGKSYPDSTVTVSLRSTATPDIQISTSGLNVQMFGELDLSVGSRSVEPKSFLTGNVTLRLSGIAYIKNEMIAGNVNNFSIKIDSTSSTLGNIEGDVLNQLLDQGLNEFLIPQFNAIAEIGMPLPLIPDVRFKNAGVTYLDGAIVVYTDVVYQNIA